MTSWDELQAGLAHVRLSPVEVGTVTLIVRRPVEEEREVLAEGVLDAVAGLVGDCWRVRPSTKGPDWTPNPEKQLTLMNSRAAALVAGPIERWPLVGDQLYVDLDLSEAALPPGTRLRVGTAVVEITAATHRGCKKFGRRFGEDALRLVNSPVGCELRLRGVNARVVAGGVVRCGDAIHRHT